MYLNRARGLVTDELKVQPSEEEFEDIIEENNYYQQVEESGDSNLWSFTPGQHMTYFAGQAINVPDQFLIDTKRTNMCWGISPMGEYSLAGATQNSIATAMALEAVGGFPLGWGNTNVLKSVTFERYILIFLGDTDVANWVDYLLGGIPLIGRWLHPDNISKAFNMRFFYPIKPNIGFPETAHAFKEPLELRSCPNWLLERLWSGIGSPFSANEITEQWSLNKESIEEQFIVDVPNDERVYIESDIGANTYQLPDFYQDPINKPKKKKYWSPSYGEDYYDEPYGGDYYR